jgi:hypothetical protein
VNLGTLDGKKSEYSIKAPLGSGYHRLIVVSSLADRQALVASLVGSFSIKTNGKELLHCELPSTNVVECAWLRKDAGLVGYHLHDMTVLNKSMLSTPNCVVELKLLANPPKATIWLYTTIRLITLDTSTKPAL